MGLCKLATAHHGSGDYFKVARPIVVLPRDQTVPLVDGGQSKQRIGYKHIKTILLFHLLHDDLQDEIDGEFGIGSEYTLDSRREVRTAVEDELEIYDVALEGSKLSSLSVPATRYE